MGSTARPHRFTPLETVAICDRDFHLAHGSRAITVWSWVAVEASGTGLPSKEVSRGTQSIAPRGPAE
ncbi:MAG TPA: hypothetical protein ENO38_00455 [Nitrososphaeria archaeon]|nr:hypothetical protein [Conexivisphaerales archaeon]HEU16132.1 hypothetical protein [Nitrososphaeria archaeon]